MTTVRRYESFGAIPLDRYDGILIDLDDTLYRYDPCHRVALEAAFQSCGMGLEAAGFARVYREARDAVTTRLAGQGACRSRLFAFQAMAEAREVSHPYLAALELDRVYWSTFLAAMRAAPQAIDFLVGCKSRAMRIAVVTDMTAHVQIEKLRRMGLTNLIDHLVTSEETGHEKPHRSMFEAGLRKIGVAGHRAVMVGDHPIKDIEGAGALGIDGALIALEECIS